jgi:hypothetical protein
MTRRASLAIIINDGRARGFALLVFEEHNTPLSFNEHALPE